MQALSDLLTDRDMTRLWQDYMALVAWSGAKAQYKEYPVPSWMEMTKKSGPQDKRTAEEIRDGIIARLSKDVSI